MNEFEDDTHKRGENCIDDETLFLYFDGQLDKKQIIKVEQHLNSCRECFDTVATLYRTNYAEMTAEEKDDIKAIMALSSDSMEIPKDTVKPETGNSKSLLKSIPARFRDFFVDLFIPKPARPRFAPAFRLAMILAALLILVSGYSGFQTVAINHQIKSSTEELRESHLISWNGVRVSGGFQGTPTLSGVMSEDDFLYPEIESKLSKALSRKNLAKGKHALARMYLLSNSTPRLAKADSILRTIDLETAALMNDVGVLYFKQQKWEKAEEKFRRAIEMDSTYSEAYFNLGQTKLNIEKEEQAKAFFEKCLEYEKNAGWQKAANDKINSIIDDFN